MNLLSVRYYVAVMISILRGFFFRMLFLKSGTGRGLRIGKQISMRGTILLGKDVTIRSNVKMSHKCIIGDNCVIDSGVELRSSKESVIIIKQNTSINRNTVIIGYVRIGSNVSIAPGCVIVGGNHIFTNLSSIIKNQGVLMKGLEIMDNVWIGANVSILDGVSIGSGSVIGAGSVVTKSIPPNSIAIGNPCKVAKTRV
jgi:acetyltransferase-like isoleucine patch superfamily enzyme